MEFVNPASKDRFNHPVLRRCIQIIEEEHSELANQKITIFADGDKKLKALTGWKDFYAHSYDDKFLVYPEFGPLAIKQMLDSTLPSLILPILLLSKQLSFNTLNLPPQQQTNLLYFMKLVTLYIIDKLQTNKKETSKINEKYLRWNQNTKHAGKDGDILGLSVVDQK